MSTPQGHYASSGIVDRILAAIPFDRESGAELTPAQLYPFDQLHGRELAATKDHVARLGARSGDHVLDIGSGIGGPARYIAATTGAKVTGIDITPEFVDAASALTKLCGLSAKVDFVRGDAAHMPFEDATFDKAVCFYVGMNLPQKAEVMSEAARVLKPGGKLLWSETALLEGVEDYFPLPWAREAAGSHLAKRTALEGMLKDAGFELVSVTDETEAHIEVAMQMRKSGQTPPVGVMQVNAVVLGEDFVLRRQNYIRTLVDKRLSSIVIDAVRR